MKAYHTLNIKRGDAAPLELRDDPIPEPVAGEVQIQVKAVGINKADVFIRQGLYHTDTEDADRLGTEFSGVITKLGANVSDWKVGDEICGVTRHAGAYAEFVTTPTEFLLKKPGNMPFEQAASLPVGLLTGWYNLVMKGGLKKGDKVLIQGGASGMGVLAVQMARALGASVYATAGSDKNCGLCQSIGAIPIDYKTQKFEDHGPYNVIYDIMGGGEYFARNVSALVPGGHLRILSFIGGNVAGGLRLSKFHDPGGEFTLPKSLLLDELKKTASTEKRDAFKVFPTLTEGQDRIFIGGDAMRRWESEDKARAFREINEKIMPLIENGTIKPVVDEVVGFEQAEKAHERIMGPHTGKIVLRGKAVLAR